VKAGTVDTVLVALVDMQGRLMGKRFHAKHFVDGAYKETHCCNYLLATDLEMSTPEGFASTSWASGYGDYVMQPDLDTLRPMPWLEGTVLVLCDVLDHHTHQPVPHSPRAMLKKQLARLEAMGMTAMMATELEFFLFEKSFDEIRKGGYRDLAPISGYNEDYNLFQTTKEEHVMRPLRNHLYDAGLPMHGLSAERGLSGAITLPSAQVGYYPWSIVQDHRHGASWLVAEDSVGDTELADIVERVLGAAPSTQAFRLERPFRANLRASDYADAFARISNYIHDGDCYQVNLAQRFSAPYSGDPLSAYRLLRPLAAAAFAGYIDVGNDRALLCLSPERFISLHQGEVTTQPIKGTRPRSQDRAADLAIARELQDSVKDRAENLMIVDLLRNDLGRNCRPGSIRVESLPGA
jgi:hypothetical protein